MSSVASEKTPLFAGSRDGLPRIALPHSVDEVLVIALSEMSCSDLSFREFSPMTAVERAFRGWRFMCSFQF